MSIGNLKDYGNKGNNFPWQLKVLEGLQAIIDNNCCDKLYGILEQIDNKLKSVTRTPGILEATGSGNTPGGVYSLSIANVGSAAGIVDGVTLPAGATINFDAGVLNHTLQTMSYNATGTTFIITFIS